MHGPSLPTLLVVFTLGLAQSSPAGTQDSVAEARRKIARDEGIAAVAILEAALPEAGAGKEAVLDLLRKAYELAARQARESGRAREAETYEENLKILNRRARTDKVAPTSMPRTAVDNVAPSTNPVPSATPLLDPSSDGPTPLPEGPAPPAEGPPPNAEITGPIVAPASPAVAEPITAAPTAGVSGPSSGVSGLPAIPVPASTADLSTADAAFAAKDYPAAGRIYGALATERRLPPERRDQWLYCRESVIKDRINARPKSEADWAEIKAEIEDIRAVDPKNLLAEYLRNLVDERYAGWRKRKPTKAMVVRGSAPEEPPGPARPVRPASNLSSSDSSVKSASPTSPASGPASRIGTNVGRWQVLDSASFRIYHADPSLAAKVAQAAETARRDQMKRWASSKAARPNWQPPCEIYLYPSAKQYAQMTGQPEDSPGFSTMGMNAGRIISRRINLRTDHPALVQAVLPHEITHVILADHFTEQQIPRWADEGLAVLSEPADEQQRRAADLVTPLAENRLFAVDVLMNMDYPDNRYWNLYYAQSVSLTRYLVEQGSPAQMIQFLQDSQRGGYEAALRKLYKIDGFLDLHRRWLAYARTKADPKGVATAPATGPDLKVR